MKPTEIETFYVMEKTGPDTWVGMLHEFADCWSLQRALKGNPPVSVEIDPTKHYFALARCGRCKIRKKKNEIARRRNK